MAGHSKWANIQHRKGAQDRKRGQVFTKLIRELTVAARTGGPDPVANARLRLAMDKARGQNMPRDTIERAIRRGAGDDGATALEEIVYEGYGPGGAAVMVACVTDNRNRTVSDLRQTFVRHGGHLGAEGSVAYLFNAVGQLTFPPGANEDAIMNAALDAGAEDVMVNEDGSIDVLTDPRDFPGIRDQLESVGLVPAAADVTRRSAITVAVAGPDAGRMAGLLEALEGLDDVHEVYSNADLPDAGPAGL